MNLIDTYISELGRRLPRRIRSDIEAEIRSTLDDMLEERSRKVGKPVDEEMTVDVLKEFGAPGKVAASYQGERYLIGPQLYPIFTIVIKVVLGIVAVLALIDLGFQLTRSGLTIEDLLNGLGGIVSSLIGVLGNVVLVFAIIEWAMRLEGYKAGGKKEKEWDPRSLHRISPPDRVKAGEAIVNIFLDFSVIVALNLYPQWIGFNSLQNGTWLHIPIFTEAFFAFVPWLTLIWVLDIALNVLTLRQGSWKPATRWLDIGLRCVLIIMFAIMLATPGLLAINSASITSTGPINSEAAGLIEKAASQGGASVLVIIILFECLEMGKHLYRLVAGSKGERGDRK